MVKNTVARAVREDPDQMFFEFALPLTGPGHTAASAGTAAARVTPTRRPRLKSCTAVRAAAAANFQAQAPSPAYITEARAAELFLQAARECGADEVRRVRVAFKPFRATLYSFRIRRNGAASVKFHLAFRNASETVLAQAAQLMLTRGRKRRRRLPRAEYDAFVRALPPSDFELPGARRSHRVSVCEPGKYQSLEESFERVNAEYFRSQLELPELCWSPARARRILGSYQERADRVIISRMFDVPDVPQFVLDYLMYHELLHKFLGIGRRDSGKRCLHGRDFKRLERGFRFYRQAQAFLKRM